MDTNYNIELGGIEALAPASSVTTKVKKKIAERSILWRVCSSLLLTCGLIYGLLCLMLLCFQNSLIFSPSHIIDTVPMQNGHSFHSIILQSNNDVRIHSWFIPAKENAGTILFCQSNKGNMSEQISTIEIWNKIGYNILLFDYQGYGMSNGEPSEENCYADAKAAYNWLKSHGYTHKNIFFHGRSMGGAVATKLAREVPCSGLILESTFTSMAGLGKAKMPYLPTSLLLYNEFPTERWLKTLKVPVLIMHSPEDETIPYKMARELFDAASTPKRFFPLTGDHRNGYKSTRGYIRTIKDFADGLKTE